MLRGMSYKHLLEWMAFSELEPFDETRADWRSAQIVAAIANSVRGRNRAAKGAKDFLLRFGDSEDSSGNAAGGKQTIAQQVAIGKMMARWYNTEHEMLEKKREAADGRRRERRNRQRTA